MESDLLVAIASLVVSVGSLLVAVLAFPATARTARGCAAAVAVISVVVAGFYAGGIRPNPPAGATPTPTPPETVTPANPTTPTATQRSGSAAAPTFEPGSGSSGGGSSGGRTGDSSNDGTFGDGTSGGATGGGSSGGSSGGGSSGGSSGGGSSGGSSAGPAVVVDPRTTVAGGTVTLTGSGFEPDAPVTFRFEASGASWSMDGFASPDANGAFTERVTLAPPSCNVGGRVLAYYGDSELLVRDANGRINEPVAAGAVTVRCG